MNLAQLGPTMGQSLGSRKKDFHATSDELSLVTKVQKQPFDFTSTRDQPKNNLEVFLFGPPKLRSGARSASFPTQKCLSILAKLMLSAGRPVARSTLIGLFWGDFPESNAKRCLNTEIWRIRRLLKSLGLDPGDYLASDADRVVFLGDSPHWLDVEAFHDGITMAFDGPDERSLAENHLEKLEEAVQLYQGVLLEGCYDDWIAPHRDQVFERYILTLEYLVATFREKGAYDRAILHARRLLNGDPYSEAGHFELMLCLFLKGRRSDALRHHKKFIALLRDELGVEPLQETVWLMELIRGHLSLEEFQSRVCDPSTEDSKPLSRIQATQTLFVTIREQIQAKSHSIW
jgi:DNA-binding SARP family transcriptional activator